MWSDSDEEKKDAGSGAGDEGTSGDKAEPERGLKVEVKLGRDRSVLGYFTDPGHRGAFATGILLILVGAFFLAVQWVPGLKLWVSWERSWPLLIVAVAAFLAVIGLASLDPNMAIPVAIVGGIGGLLYYQNLTGDWGSWAYAWALIPGFVGVGMLVSGLLRGFDSRGGRTAIEGLTQIVTSIVLFAVFGSFLGGPEWLTRYWPVAIVLLGLWIMVRPRRWHRNWNRRTERRAEREERRAERRDRRNPGWRDDEWRDGQ